MLHLSLQIPQTGLDNPGHDNTHNSDSEDDQSLANLKWPNNT